ncbi:ankyrin repeat domain-containing protein [Thiotrichales bacterium 19S11-10]|nr:ankyrin repeat domain-containing protein [Thiotrichales bacterium 19S11-10]
MPGPHIKNITFTSGKGDVSYVGEFNRTDYGATQNVLNRMLNQMGYLIWRLSREQSPAEEYWTRAATNEFSFYPAGRPLKLAEYQYIVDSIYNLAKKYKLNSSALLLLSSMPVAWPDGTYRNIALHIQGGGYPIIRQISKKNQSAVDFVYSIGSGYKTKFIGDYSPHGYNAYYSPAQVMSGTYLTTDLDAQRDGAIIVSHPSLPSFIDITEICLDHAMEEGKSDLSNLIAYARTSPPPFISHTVSSGWINISNLSRQATITHADPIVGGIANARIDDSANCTISDGFGQHWECEVYGVKELSLVSLQRLKEIANRLNIPPYQLKYDKLPILYYYLNAGRKTMVTDADILYLINNFFYDINDKYSSGETLLSLAIEKKWSNEIILKLLEKGAKIDLLSEENQKILATKLYKKAYDSLDINLFNNLQNHKLNYKDALPNMLFSKKKAEVWFDINRLLLDSKSNISAYIDSLDSSIKLNEIRLTQQISLTQHLYQKAYLRADPALFQAIINHSDVNSAQKAMTNAHTHNSNEYLWLMVNYTITTGDNLIFFFSHLSYPESLNNIKFDDKTTLMQRVLQEFAKQGEITFDFLNKNQPINSELATLFLENALNRHDFPSANEVKKYIDAGANPNSVGKDTGRTALHVAAHTGNIDLLNQLLDMPNVTLNSELATLFLENALNRNDFPSTDEVKKYINAGANPNSTGKETGRTALHVAAHKGNVELLKQLINHKDITLQTLNRQTEHDKNTALHLAKDADCSLTLLTCNSLQIDTSIKNLAVEYAFNTLKDKNVMNESLAALFLEISLRNGQYDEAHEINKKGYHITMKDSKFIRDNRLIYISKFKEDFMKIYSALYAGQEKIIKQSKVKNFENSAGLILNKIEQKPNCTFAKTIELLIKYKFSKGGISNQNESLLNEIHDYAKNNSGLVLISHKGPNTPFSVYATSHPNSRSAKIYNALGQ